MGDLLPSRAISSALILLDRDPQGLKALESQERGCKKKLYLYVKMPYIINMPRVIAKRTTDPDNKKERFEARITISLKERLEQAAALSGLNVSAFVVQQIEKATDEVLRQHEQRRYSKSDQEIFFEALQNPPEANDKLKALAERYFQKRRPD